MPTPTNMEKVLASVKAETKNPAVEVKDDDIANKVLEAEKADLKEQTPEVNEYAAAQNAEEAELFGADELEAAKEFIRNQNRLRIEDEFLHGSVVARPLGQVDTLNLIPKDPAYVFRWVQRKAQDGQRYEQCLAMGFENAKIGDIKNYTPSVMTSSDGSSVLAGDLILMKMQKTVYYGALKANFQRSQRMVSQDGSRASALAMARATAGKIPNGLADKVGFFNPGSSFAVPGK